MTPRSKATVVCLALYAPYVLARGVYDEQLSERAWIYLLLLFTLPAALLYQWVYHRELQKLPAPALPKAELSLAVERMPKVVWLAILPPLIAAALLWWITTHGSELPWRDTWLGPPMPATSHRTFRFAAVAFVVWNCLGTWRAALGLAQWHGMPRAYTSRRERLELAIAVQWLLLINFTAWSCTMLFRMPVMLAIIVGVVVGAGFSAMMWVTWQEPRFRRQGEPAIGVWFYFDSGDPAFLGPRGLNVASAWSWVLATVAATPIVLAEWLLHTGKI